MRKNFEDANSQREWVEARMSEMQKQLEVFQVNNENKPTFGSGKRSRLSKFSRPASGMRIDTGNTPS